jgi:TonB family protein
MRKAAIFCVIVLVSCESFAGKRQEGVPMPESFVIGRHTFVDFGPPLDYYEIITVQPNGTGTAVRRVLLTPAGDTCNLPAKIESSSAETPESVPSLLGNKNPCSIPDKDLNRELKRRKKGLVFSGVEIRMQVRCGATNRLIRADVLDRDMFDPNPRTPENTSWTMQLLQQIDKTLGPGVWDKHMFSTEDGAPKPVSLDASVAQALSDGVYDGLFAGAPDKPSVVYADTKKTIPNPAVVLVEVGPYQPVSSTLPGYPPLAKLARIEGSVVARVTVGAHGDVAGVNFESGHPLLKPSVEDALQRWKFAPELAGQQVRATISFQRNCPAK